MSHSKSKTVSGYVRFYSETRGFGFIAQLSPGPDVLIDRRVLSDFGRASVSSGSAIVASAMRTRQGWRASRIISLRSPPGAESQNPKDRRPDVAPDAPWIEATLKWMNPARGYGFLETKDGDAFIHIRIFYEAGITEFRKREPFEAKVGLIDGRLATAKVRRIPGC